MLLHTRAVVSTAAHDQLIPAALRGPATPFEAKAAALQQRVREWCDALLRSGLPELENLARRVRGCHDYGTCVATEAARTPCRCRLCPYCFARDIDQMYRRLRIADPAVITLAGAVPQVSMLYPVNARTELRQLMRTSRRHVSRIGQGAVVRCSVQPPPTRGACDVSFIAVIPMARPFPGLEQRGIRVVDGHVPHYEPSQLPGTEETFAAVMRECWSYPHWAMAPTFLDELPKLLACTRGLKEFEEVAPSPRLSAKPPSYAWVKGS